MRVQSCEQVSSGHPDKICDRIADSVLDYCLRFDKNSLVGCVVSMDENEVVVGGYVFTESPINERLSDIVYDCLFNSGLDYSDSLKVVNKLAHWNLETAHRYKHVFEAPCTVYGHATNETKDFLPYAWKFATDYLMRLSLLTIDGFNNNVIANVNIVNSIHPGKKELKSVKILAHVSGDEVVDSVKEKLIKQLHMLTEEYGLPKCNDVIITILSDCAIIGRSGNRNASDFYGTDYPVTMLPLSGKDSTHTERSGSYMARWIAKNIVRDGYADKCSVRITYNGSQGEKPTLDIHCYGTEKIGIEYLSERIASEYNLTVLEAEDLFDLRKSIYHKTSYFGHFGIAYYGMVAWENLKWDLHINK